MNEKGWTGYADNRYAEQRNAGFPWLRFEPTLEAAVAAAHQPS